MDTERLTKWKREKELNESPGIVKLTPRQLAALSQVAIGTSQDAIVRKCTSGNVMATNDRVAIFIDPDCENGMVVNASAPRNHLSILNEGSVVVSYDLRLLKQLVDALSQLSDTQEDHACHCVEMSFPARVDDGNFGPLVIRATHEEGDAIGAIMPMSEVQP